MKVALIKNEQKVEDQTPKYRDRASERRVMHNQPEAPVPSPGPGGGNSGNGRRSAPGPPKPPSPPPPPLNPGQDGDNVGNKLLKMMGWTEGTGLGTNGEGRVDPMYVGVPFLPLLPLTLHLQTNCHLCTRCGARCIQRQRHRVPIQQWLLFVQQRPRGSTRALQRHQLKQGKRFSYTLLHL